MHIRNTLAILIVLQTPAWAQTVMKTLDFESLNVPSDWTIYQGRAISSKIEDGRLVSLPTPYYYSGYGISTELKIGRNIRSIEIEWDAGSIVQNGVRDWRHSISLSSLPYPDQRWAFGVSGAGYAGRDYLNTGSADSWFAKDFPTQDNAHRYKISLDRTSMKFSRDGDNMPSHILSTTSSPFVKGSGVNVLINGEAHENRLWIDNIKITEIPAKTYGLFIGVQDKFTESQESFVIPPKTDKLLGNQAAYAIGKAFESHGVESTYRLADITSGGGVKSVDILGELEIIRNKMLPGDTIVIYMAAHGSSVSTNFPEKPINGLGSEFIQLGPWNDPSYRIYDSQLAEALNSFEGMQKIVFLDACMSGGFWQSRGAADPTDNGMHLADLENIALYAAGDEFTPVPVSMYGVFAPAGRTAWGSAVEAAAIAGLDNFDPDALADYLKRESFWVDGIEPVYGNASSIGGLLYPGKLSSQPFFSKSSDFGIDSGLVSSVDEPATLAYLLCGVAAFRLARSLRLAISPTLPTA